MAPRKRSGGQRGSTQPADQKPSAVPSDDTPRGRKGGKKRGPGVPQPHGGTLFPGAGGGPQPGSGRPRSVIRSELLQSFDKRKGFLDQVIDGEVVERRELPLHVVLPHVYCSGEVKDGKCAGKILPNDPADVLLIRFEARVSASVRERLSASDVQARYSLGALKGVLQDKVEENVRKTLDVLKSRLPPDLFETVRKELQPIWSGS